MTDLSQLRRVLHRVRLLMLDFDGPICRIFARYTAPTIADELRHLVASRGMPLTGDLLSTKDPLQVLRLVGKTGDQALTAEVASALRDAELMAIESAELTPGITHLLAATANTGHLLAIVSNNSVEAITAYVDRLGISSRFAALAGRQIHEPPNLMKPHPHLLRVALAAAKVSPHEAVLVGDSVTDILAAKSASVYSIGFRPDRAGLDDLVRVGADASVNSLLLLASEIATS